MEQKVEKEVRSRLEEMSIDMNEYKTKWIEIDDIFDSGEILFKHGNGHTIEVRFSYDEDSDIIDFRIDAEY